MTVVLKGPHITGCAHSRSHRFELLSISPFTNYEQINFKVFIRVTKPLNSIKFVLTYMFKDYFLHLFEDHICEFRHSPAINIIFAD